MGKKPVIRPFGEIAMGKGFISLDQLLCALNTQVRDYADRGEHKLIGTILYEQGSLDADQFSEVRNLCRFTRVNVTSKKTPMIIKK